MHRTVNLDHQPKFWAVEIDDVATDAVLAVKEQVVKLPAFEVTPKLPLGWSRIVSQLSAEWFVGIQVI